MDTPQTTVHSPNQTSPFRPVFGQASLHDGVRVHQTHEEAIAAAHLDPQDPRKAITPRHMQRYAHQTQGSLEASALRMTHDGPDPSKGKNDIRVVAAIHAARTAQPNHFDTDPDYGDTGRLARALEVTGLHMYHEGLREGNDADIEKSRHLLTIAATAHNVAARTVASLGYSNHYPSIVEATAFQNRPVATVAADLVKHRIIRPDDPRVAIAQQGVQMDLHTAIGVASGRGVPATTPAPMEKADMDHIAMTQGFVRGRRAEERALGLLGRTGGTQEEQAGRTQEATQLLTAAFSLAEHRRTALQDRQLTPITMQETRPSKGAQPQTAER